MCGLSPSYCIEMCRMPGNFALQANDIYLICFCWPIVKRNRDDKMFFQSAEFQLSPSAHLAFAIIRRIFSPARALKSVK